MILSGKTVLVLVIFSLLKAAVSFWVLANARRLWKNRNRVFVWN